MQKTNVLKPFYVKLYCTPDGSECGDPEVFSTQAEAEKEAIADEEEDPSPDNDEDGRFYIFKAVSYVAKAVPVIKKIS